MSRRKKPDDGAGSLFGDTEPERTRDRGGSLRGASIDVDALVPPPHSNETTSAAAALSMVLRSGTDRANVLREFQHAGADGLTTDEVEVRTGLSHQNASARVWELRGNPRKSERPALLVDSGRKRPTRSGRMAIAWICA